MVRRRLSSCIAMIILASWSVLPVLAHTAEPRLEINLERTNPGAVVDVRGVSFGMDDEVNLALIGPGLENALEIVSADGLGDFIYIATLPSDLAEGTYYFRATTAHHWVLSPPLMIWGSAALQGGSQGERDDEDGLLMAMPTLAPVTPVSVPATSVPAPPTPSNFTRSNWSFILGAGVLFLLLFVVVRRK